MNDFIQHIDKLSFSVSDGLHISIIQLLLMFTAIAFLSLWIFHKNVKNFITGITCLILFFALHDVYALHQNAQSKLIVYNVAKQNAVDIIAGHNCCFAGDSIILQDAFLRNFNIKPSRVKYGCYNSNNVMLPDIADRILKIDTSKILFLKTAGFYAPIKEKIKLDVLILTANINQSPAELSNYFECDYIVAGSSIPQWKTLQWKKECEQLHLRFYSVAQDGAFILNL